MEHRHTSTIPHAFKVRDDVTWVTRTFMKHEVMIGTVNDLLNTL